MTVITHVLGTKIDLEGISSLSLSRLTLVLGLLNQTKQPPVYQSSVLQY